MAMCLRWRRKGLKSGEPDRCVVDPGCDFLFQREEGRGEWMGGWRSSRRVAKRQEIETNRKAMYKL